MSKNSSSSTRRGVLASAAVAGAFGLLIEQAPQAGTTLPTPEGPGSASGECALTINRRPFAEDDGASSPTQYRERRGTRPSHSRTCSRACRSSQPGCRSHPSGRRMD